MNGKKEYLWYKHALKVFFFSLWTKYNIVSMSAGSQSNTHKQCRDTGFPSNVHPIQAGWALRAEEEKRGKGFR